MVNLFYVWLIIWLTYYMYDLLYVSFIICMTYYMYHLLNETGWEERQWIERQETWIHKCKKEGAGDYWWIQYAGRRDSESKGIFSVCGAGEY